MDEVTKLIDAISHKKGITEVVINGPDSVFVERGGKFIELSSDLTESDLIKFVEQVKKYPMVNEYENIIAGSLPDGSRLNIVTPPVSEKYPAITIRRYLKNILSFNKNEGIFGIHGKWKLFLKSLIDSKRNILITGGTGSGKTTLLNLCLQEVAESERIITIEDTKELYFTHRNKVSLSLPQNIGESNLSIRDLVKNALRMRPDRIIVGECRGGEFFDLLTAMNTGHQGSMSTLHANSISESLSRMESLFLLSGFDVPINVIRKYLCLGIDFIIHIERDKNGKRVIKNIKEISKRLEGDQILSTDIALLEEDKLKLTGLVPACRDILVEEGSLPKNFF